MRASTIAFGIIGAAGIASAIKFTSPAANATVARGEGKHEVSWTSVDTDPKHFSIYLVNFVNWPPYYKQLAANVETASGAASVRIPCHVDVSGGYQLNAINGTNVYVIYAQTPKFSIAGASCQDPVVAEPTICGPAVTVTATVTVSPLSPLALHPTTFTFAPGGSSSSSSSSSDSNGNINSEKDTYAVVARSSLVTSAAAGPATTTVAPPAPHVNAGTCPDTIGWGPAGYGSPVTLTHVPHPSDDAASVPVAANSALSTAAPTSVAYNTVGNVVYKTVYMDLADYVASGACGCDA